VSDADPVPPSHRDRLQFVATCGDSLRSAKPMSRSLPLMKRYVLVLSLVVGSAAPCRANIGESEAAIEGRYGKSFGQIPTSTFGVVTGFIAGGYVIGVKFVDGVSEMEMFSKGNQSDMPASEIDRLLKKNSAGDWKAELTGKPHWRRWRRDDASAVALYDAARHFLYINSKNFYEIKGQQIEQQQWNFSDKPQSSTTGTPKAVTPETSSSPATASAATPAASPTPSP
jgi:cell division septation protein DedD